MKQISYRRHRFPSSIIQHAVWLYFRFPLSYRDIEDMLAERGIDVSYETVRRWSLMFGLGYARTLRRLRPRPDGVLASGQGVCLDQWQAHVPLACSR
jgi:transposase-like protein